MFSLPSQAGLSGEGFFHDGCCIHEEFDMRLVCMMTDPLSNAFESFFKDKMIVITPSIDRNIGNFWVIIVQEGVFVRGVVHA